MNEDDHLDRCNDLNLNHLTDKIKTGFQSYESYIDDQPPFYSLSKKENNDYKIKSSNEYHHNYLNNEIETNDCKLINNELNNKLDSELNIKLNNELTNCDNQINMPPPPQPSSLYSDLYGQNLIQNVQCNNQNTMSNTTFLNASNIGNNLNCINDPQIYQSTNTSSSNTTQSILMNKVSLLNSNNNLKIPFDHNNHHLNSPIDELNKQQQKIQQQTIYAKINQPILTNFDQHINEIYQYAASDQLSKSSDSDAAYSTLKLDTASCNSSLISGINNEQQILKCGFPPIYTSSPATYLTSLNEQNSNNETTDSGYTFSSQNSKQLNNSTAMINLDNNHIQGLKNQFNQFNQYNQQINSPAECLYQSNNNNFVRSRTTIDLNHNNSSDTLQTSNSHHQNLNTSVSNYSFYNLHSNQDDLSQYSTKNSYLTYSQTNQLPNDIAVLSPILTTPIPSSSTKEALIQQQLSNHINSNCTNLVIMSNNDILAHQQSNLTSSTSNNLQDNWYKLLSRRLRERYLSKRKIQDSSFDTKKNKLDLDNLDNLDDKKAITTNRTPLNLFYQLFLIKKCSLIPCLLIFACALLIFTLMLFTLLTYYFKNQQNLLNDQLLLTNLHTQLQSNSINNKISNSLNNLSNQQTTSSTNNFAFDMYNKILIGLSSIIKGISLTSTNTGYQIPNSLTTGDSLSGKHSAQTESQIKFKQYQTINWFKSAIFYEVFVASFQDSNSDGIGDIDGLISRLGYIKELGVTVIRLNSIYSALDYPYQYSNILNHTEIEKQLGSIDDFRRLVHNCHNIGLRIVLDLNPCITSDQHRWAAHFLMNKTDDSHNYYVNTSDYVCSFFLLLNLLNLLNF